MGGCFALLKDIFFFFFFFFFIIIIIHHHQSSSIIHHPASSIKHQAPSTKHQHPHNYHDHHHHHRHHPSSSIITIHHSSSNLRNFSKLPRSYPKPKKIKKNWLKDTWKWFRMDPGWSTNAKFILQKKKSLKQDYFVRKISKVPSVLVKFKRFWVHRRFFCPWRDQPFVGQAFRGRSPGLEV